jgi:competence/damage-inducible protein CinA-like protein
MERGVAGPPLLPAELLSVGSELTVGDTRDTNAGELARDLTERGVRVLRLGAVPDELDTVRTAMEAASGRADLVVTTGGLGPTPDDLTREAVAALVGEEPTIDPEMEAWLRDRFERRGMAFPESNLKQAWRIPSAEALPNPNGTAPGWLVRLSNERIIVTLPGPPREMRPMWRDEAIPRLAARGLGREIVARTYRLHGIGESHVAELLGEELLRSADPQVATYARVEAVDVRVASSGPGAGARVAAAADVVEERLGRYVWATGDTTWAEAVEAALAERRWTLAIAEFGMGGALTALLGGLDAVVRCESTTADGGEATDLEALAENVRSAAQVDIGVAARAIPRGEDTALSVTVLTPAGERTERRVAFLGGSIGRSRAAMSVAAVLLNTLRDGPEGAPQASAARRAPGRSGS